MFTAVSTKRECRSYRQAPSKVSAPSCLTRGPNAAASGCNFLCPAQLSPCLSPVSTQILMLASVRRAMVSGTPC